MKKLAVSLVLLASVVWASGERKILGGTQGEWFASAPWTRTTATSMRFQARFDKSKLEAGSITFVEFYVYNPHVQDYMFGNLEVWLCHTHNASLLSSTFVNNYVGTPLQVGILHYTIPAMYTGWHGPAFNRTPFPYNGTDNLLIEITWAGGSGGNAAIGIARASAPYLGGCVYVYNRSGSTGTRLDYSFYVRIGINSFTGLAPTSLGRVKSLYR